MANNLFYLCSECRSVADFDAEAAMCECGCNQWIEMVCTCCIIWPTIGLYEETIFIHDRSRPCTIHAPTLPKLLPPPATEKKK